MIPKHGANSARTKACAKYKAEGRRERNKGKHILAQKKFTEKKQQKRERREAKKGDITNA